MAKKTAKKRSVPSAPSILSSSSSDKDSPPPPIPPVKKLFSDQKDEDNKSPNRIHRSKRQFSRDTEDVKSKTLAKDNSSDCEEEEWTDDQSSYDNQDSQTANEDFNELNSRAELKEPLNSFDPISDPLFKPSNSSNCVVCKPEEEEEEEEVEEEEEEEEIEEEEEEDFENMDEKEIKTVLSALPVEKQPAQISEKKKTARRVGAEGETEKELFKRIWSNEDELALLQGILDYKERNHVIPYAHEHAKSLLNNVKDSLAISVSVQQINDKVRRMKKRYNNTATRKSLAKRSRFSDPHNAVVFDMSKKIWENLKEESILFENKVTRERKEESVDEKEKELKHFAGEYPSLCWFLRSEHADIAPVLQNHIPFANADKLEEK